MNWKYWTIAAAVLFSGPLFAQMEGGTDEEVKQEVDTLFASHDGNKDGKISKAEYRAGIKAESGIEDETSWEFLDHWKYKLIDYLCADTDDNLEVTKPELTAYLKQLYAAESDKMGKLTKKDVGVLDDEYLEPACAFMLKLLDADKDGKISRKEGDAMEMGEIVSEYDANKDGFLDSMEIKVSEVEAIATLYEVEAGYTLKGEPSKKVETPVEVPEAIARDFKAIDADKDGFISKEEMKANRTKGQTNRAYWWGVYIAFLSIDTNDDLKVDLQEFARYGKDEKDGVPHQFYPKDKTEAMNEIWADLDADKDGKATKAEFGKLFPDDSEYDGMDADSDGNVTKDEFWEALKPQFGEAFAFPDKDRETGTTDNGGTSSSGGTANPDDPMWALYKKVGRSWTFKNTSKAMGMEIVSYVKYEVVKVEADHAMVKMTVLDAEKKESPYMKPTETKIEFKTGGGTGTAEGAPKVKDLGVETIKVEGGEFECQVTEVEVELPTGKATTKAWSSKKWTGLSVKVVTSGSAENVMELVEFKE